MWSEKHSADRLKVDCVTVWQTNRRSALAKDSKQSYAAPLSETEIDELDAFLSELTGPIRSLEGFDGLVCALACAPTEISYDEYIPAVVGADGFASESLANQIEMLTKRHKDSVQWGLHNTLESEALYEPALLVDEDGKALGNQWALGFLLGVSMTHDDWAEFTQGEKMARMLLPMMVLAHEHHPDPQMRPSPIPDEGREEILHMMANSLALIYEHFHGKPISPN